MAPGLVFITGSTGFIGSQVTVAALKAGHRVRLSVRKQEQIDNLKKTFAAFSNNVDFAVVSDITKVEPFANVLDGVDYIFHLASPMPGKGTDVRIDYVDPAVQGTEAIMSAATQQPSIKVMIIMSSVASIIPLGDNLAPVVSVKDNTGETIPIDLDMQFPDGLAGDAVKYQASKILAHQASRDFVKNNSPHYKLFTFHPTFVIGNSLVQDSAQAISGMNALLWDSIHLEKPVLHNAFVHVRDVADAHLRALDANIPSGTEFLLNGPYVGWEEIAEIVRRNYPTVNVKLQPPFESKWKVDVSTADKYLGLKWRSAETMVKDVLDQQLMLRSKA